MKQVITPDRKVVVLNDDGTWKYATATAAMLRRLKTTTVPANIVESLQGMFSKLGIHVIDTGEEFTCIHRDDHIEFVSGLKASDVDFAVEVFAFQLERLAAHVDAGELEEVEQFRIARTLFTAGTGKRHVMSNPLMSNSVLRRLIRGKNLMHVYLVSPDLAQEPDASYTVMFINDEWLVIPGLHGHPKRVLRVPIGEAIELQKHLFAGMKSGNLAKWMKIAKWYVDWRKRVEVTT